jgi:purine-nucleoside phosphorylase
MVGANPLIGPNLDEFGPRFPATNHLYTQRLRTLAVEVAEQKAVDLRRGVYVWLSGPAYESPAEARMLRGLGADAVGMSTVPEALVAGHAGMEVLAFSMITNMVIDRLDATGAPTAEEVLAAGSLIVPRFTRLLQGIVVKLAADPAT